MTSKVVTTLFLIMLLACVQAAPMGRNRPGRNQGGRNARKLLTAAAETAVSASDKEENKHDAACVGPTAVAIWSNGEPCCCSADYRGMACESGEPNEYWTLISGHPCCCLADYV